MKHQSIFYFITVFFGILSCNSITDTSQQDISAASVDTVLVVAEPNTVLSELEKNLKKQGLVNIQDVDPSIMVALKYSTTDNFFGEDVYGTLTNAYLQPDVAEKLKTAQQLLKQENPAFSLLVYDGVRPHSVQKILWEKLDSIPPKTREAYVANPAEGSIHNYGCAVDLTIYSTELDSTLDMGTKYDYFGFLAYPRKEKENVAKGLLTPNQVANRLILRTVMMKAGFLPITSEWWHFNAMSRVQAEQTYRIVQ